MSLVRYNSKIIITVALISLLSACTRENSLYFLSIVDFKNNVGYFGIELEVYAGILEVFLHRKNQGFILVVLREFQCGEVRQSADVVNEPLEVQLHLQCTMPVFECEHRSPVQPEGGIEDFIIENILDRLVVRCDFLNPHRKRYFAGWCSTSLPTTLMTTIRTFLS